MKIHLTQLLLIISVFGYGQNYGLFNGSDTLYFKSESASDEYGTILSVAFDSTEYIAGDSVYYPYKTLQSNPVDSLFNCDLVWNGNWLGKKVIEKQSGEFLFVSGYNDTLYIDPTASLGDVFNICDIFSSDSVTGTITDLSVQNFLTYTDTVKTITINSSSSNFNFENTEIKVSKNHGIISIVPLYEFPYGVASVAQSNVQFNLVGQENPRLGITMPTFYDIHNLEVGDEIVYGTSIDNLHYYLKNKTIISKTILPGNEVEYEIMYKEEYTYSGTSQFDPAYSQITTDTITENYSIENTYITNLLPGQTQLVLSDMSHSLLHSDQCGFKSYMVTQNSYEDESFECRSTWHMDNVRYGSISGANNYYYRCWNIQPEGCKEITSLSYKSNSGIECGTPYFVSSNKIKTGVITIFPNPTDNIIKIESSLSSFFYSLYDLSEKKVLTGSETNFIDVSELPDGVYFLKIYTDKNLLTTKKIVIY